MASVLIADIKHIKSSLIFPIPSLFSPANNASVHSPLLHFDSPCWFFIIKLQTYLLVGRVLVKASNVKRPHTTSLIYFTCQINKAQTTNMQPHIFLALSALTLFITSVLAAPVSVNMVARQQGAFTSAYISRYIPLLIALLWLYADESIPVKSEGGGVVVPYKKERT